MTDRSIEPLIRALVREVIRDEVRSALADATKADEFLTTKAAAKVAGVHEGTIQRWATTGKLTKHRAGRLIRISRIELEQVIREGQRARNDETPEQLAKKRYG